MITYQEEEYSPRLWIEMYPLLEDNDEEMRAVSYELEPNRALYDAAANMQSLVVYTAREEGRIVGYVAYFLAPNLHYRVLSATADILYVDPEYRKGFLGIKLIKKAEEVLKDKYNVELILQHSSIRRPLDPLLTRLGYKECEKVFIKEI